MDRFPTLSDAQYRQLLRLPGAMPRCVIDTDARNEIDDQLALAWALLSPEALQIEAIYAAPYSFLARWEALKRSAQIRANPESASASELERLAEHRGQLERLERAGVDVHDRGQLDPQGRLLVSPKRGMELSHDEILRVCDLLGADMAGRVFRGSTRYLESLEAPVESEAAAHLIETARTATPDEPLYVLAIGAATNVAAALLLAPDIIERVVIVWTAGYPTTVMDRVQPSFNMEQDIQASQLLFDSGAALVYLPGFHVGAQLSLSLPEVEAWVQGRGKIGDYLHRLYLNNPHRHFQGIAGHLGRSWIMWDLINFAWLMNPAWTPSYIIDAPYLSDDCRWLRPSAPRHPIREALDINRDAIFGDFFRKLESAP